MKRDVNHDHLRVVQHLSGTCRAARREQIRELPAAQLLMQIDDSDMKLCHDIRYIQLTWWQICLISIPLFFGFAGDQGQEFAFDMVINVTWGSLLIIHALLIQVINPLLVVGFYVLVMIFCIYRAYKFYKKRNTKRQAKRSSRGELARFMSQKAAKRPKFNAIAIMKRKAKRKRDESVLVISKQELHWRNMNLRLQQPVTEVSHTAQLSAHAISIPDSIRELSALAPLLTAHLPPPVGDVEVERPASWHRPTSIRSKHRSKRVAAFWESRKESARESQRQSPLYLQCRAHFLRLANGANYIDSKEDILALATWLHSLKEEGNVDADAEIQEIALALEFLMLYYEQTLPLDVFLDWVTEEDILLDQTFGSALSMPAVLSKAELHNEIEYSNDKASTSRLQKLLTKNRVRKHRKKGEVDLFGLISKEVAMEKQTEKAMAAFYAEQYDEEGGVLNSSHDKVRGNQATKMSYQQQMAAMDHQRAKKGTTSKKISTSFQSFFSNKRNDAANKRNNTNKNKRDLLRRRTDTFYKHNPKKEVRFKVSTKSGKLSTPHENEVELEPEVHEEPARQHLPVEESTSLQDIAPAVNRKPLSKSSSSRRVTSSSRTSSGQSGAVAGGSLDNMLSGRKKGPPPPVKVFSIKSTRQFTL